MIFVYRSCVDSYEFLYCDPLLFQNSCGGGSMTESAVVESFSYDVTSVEWSVTGHTSAVDGRPVNLGAPTKFLTSSLQFRINTYSTITYHHNNGLLFTSRSIGLQILIACTIIQCENCSLQWSAMLLIQDSGKGSRSIALCQLLIKIL